MILPAVIFGVAAGCATKQAATQPRPGEGIKEYRQIVTDSETAVRGAIHWLDRISAETNQFSMKLVAGFSQKVDQLQAESVRVRARAQAIQARGDAYFEAWSKNLTPEGAPPAPKTPEQLSQLQEAFSKIKIASQQTGDAFKPFFAGLRHLRVNLEINPSSVQSEEGRQLLRTTRDQGSEVIQKLGAVKGELQALIVLITTGKPIEKH